MLCSHLLNFSLVYFFFAGIPSRDYITFSHLKRLRPLLTGSFSNCPCFFCLFVFWVFFFFFFGLFFAFYFFCFLGPHLQQMEVPRLGVKSELQLLACMQHSNARSELCLGPHGNAGSLTHWARPGIEPVSSWILLGYLLLRHNRNFQTVPVFDDQFEEYWLDIL